MSESSRRKFLAAAGSALAVIGTKASATEVIANKIAAKPIVHQRFKNKVVLITGATSGIGEASAIAFAKEGAKVFFCGRRESLGKEVEAKIKSQKGEATFLKADVTKSADMELLVKTCVLKYGKIDIAFNNAGSGLKNKSFFEISEDDFNNSLNTNVLGVFLAMKFEIKEMLKNKSGIILNMASVAGHKGIRPADYVASKHAVVGLTKSAAFDGELAGLRINSISPGLIKTALSLEYQKYFSQHPDQLGLANTQSRFGEATEVASAVLWLCSEEASFVHGADFCIDGGSAFG